MGAARSQCSNEPWHDQPQLAFERPRRIDDDEPAGAQAVGIARWKVDLRAQDLADAETTEPMRQNVRGLTFFERIPQQIYTTRPLAVGAFQRVAEAREIARVFERRVNQDKAAPLPGRYIRIKGGPAIDRDGLAAPVPLEIACERGCRARLELAGH